MRRVVEAREAGDSSIVMWGTGTPLREFMHCDDLADALVFLMQHYSEYDHINVGSGIEISIADLMAKIADAAGYDGEIVKDTTKPDGTPRKLMDSARLLGMGWAPRISFEEGLRKTLAEFEQIHSVSRKD